jgi:hypothetical protein
MLASGRTNHADLQFAFKELGNIESRIMKSSQAAVEEKHAARRPCESTQHRSTRSFPQDAHAQFLAGLVAKKGTIKPTSFT